MPDSQYSQIPNYAPVNTEVAALDYSFLQNALSTKEKQYEAGQSQVKSLYNSVLHSQLTNPENIQERDKYIQEANNSMKALSKADLSLPKNMGEAQKVFAPFWEDADIVADIYNTKKIQNQKSLGQAQLDSTDEKIREQYNPNSIALLDYSTLDLRRAKRGDGSIAKVNIPNYVPQIDIKKYANDIDKASNFDGISIDVENDPELITYKNGARAHLSLKTRYTGIVGDKFGAQFGVDGTLQRRQLEEELLRNNPGADINNLRTELSKYVYDKLSSQYKESLLYINNDIKNKLDNKIQLLEEYIKNNPKESVAQEPFLNSLKEQRDNELLKLANITEEYTDFLNKHPDQKIADIERNPDGYFAKLARETSINDLTAQRESDISVTRKVNPRWAAMDEHDYRVGQMQNQKVQNDLAAKRIEAELMMAGQRNLVELWKGRKDIGTNPKSPWFGVFPATDGSTSHYLGAATADQSHQTVPEILAKQQADRVSIANNEIASPIGVTPILVKDNLNPSEKGTGLDSTTELPILNTFLQRYFAPGGEATQPNDKEKAVLKKATQFLADNLNRTIPINPVDFRKALLEYSSKERNTRAQLGILDPVHLNAYTATKKAEKVIDEWKSTENLINQYKQNILAKNKDKYKNLPTKENIENYINTITDAGFNFGNRKHTLEDESGSKINISSTELAEALSKGEITPVQGKAPNDMNYPMRIPFTNTWVKSLDQIGPSSSNTIQYKGKNYKINNTLFETIGKIPSKFFGEKAQEDNVALKEDIAKYFPNLQKQTEVTGRMFGYPLRDPDDKDQPGAGYKLLVEAIEPANKQSILINGRSLDDESSTPDEDYHLLKSIIENQKAFENVGGNVNVVHSLTNQTARVKFQVLNEKKNGIFAGKEITIPLSPSATGEVISTLPSNSGFYIYNGILESPEGAYKTTPDDEALGAKMSITVDNFDNPRFFVINSQKQDYDPKSKTWFWKTIDNNTLIPISDRTPDELVNFQDNWVNRTIAERQANQKVINKGK